ncbi:MAG: hypothetical protein QM500_00625 [Methylococcales bacterium]
MGVFRLFTSIADNYSGIEALITGSNILLNTNTDIDVLGIDKEIMQHADTIIEEYYFNIIGKDLTQEEAALLKLNVFYATAEHNEHEQMKTQYLEAIVKTKRAFKGRIRLSITMDLRENTGC